MRRIILFLVLMVSMQAHSQEVQCTPESINIQEGDVVSADVLNDIFARINNIITGGIDTEDLVGTWQCTSTLRPGAEGSGVIHNGYSQNTFGLYTVTQEVIISYTMILRCDSIIRIILVKVSKKLEHKTV